MNTDKRKSFVFYRDWYDTICKLDEKTGFELSKAIMSIAFGEEPQSLSNTTEAMLMLVRPQIERDFDKWLDIREKRSIAGRKHTGNQHVRKVEQMEQVLSNGTNDNKMEQSGTNGTVNVNVNVDNNDVVLKEKEDTDVSKKKEIYEFVERMYKLYPTKCPMRNTSLGKCYKDKERIRKLLKTYSQEDVERVIKHEVDEKYGKSYMQNFSTFLNNFPDPQSLFGERVKEESQDTSNNLYPEGYWQ